MTSYERVKTSRECKIICVSFLEYTREERIRCTPRIFKASFLERRGIIQMGISSGGRGYKEVDRQDKGDSSTFCVGWILKISSS